MNFNRAIEQIMPLVNDGSTEPFIIYRDIQGEWHSDFTKDKNGETLFWIEEVKSADPFAVEFTGKDFAHGSFPCVFDKVLTARIRAEFNHNKDSGMYSGDSVKAFIEGMDEKEAYALVCFFEDNIGIFSQKVTDYLTTLGKPFTALAEMSKFDLSTDYEDCTYDEELAYEAIEYIENEVNDRLHNYKNIIPEKRYIDGYEEKYCIEIAGKYVVLAENLYSESSYLVCNIKYDNPLGMEERYDGSVNDNYIEAMRKFVNRVDGLLKTLEAERCKSGLPLQILTAAEHCIPGSQNADFEDKLIIIKPEILALEYRSAEHQLVLCTGGFGASAEARGRAVYIKELYSGKESRYNRHQIAGLADLKKIPNWAIDKLLESHKKDESDKNVSNAPKTDIKPQEKIPEQKKKKPTLQEKLANAKQKAAQENSARKNNRGDRTKKHNGRE
jgi:hypothetical protein